MVGVWIVFIAFLLCVLGGLSIGKKYIALMVILIGSALPLFEGWRYNAIEMIYAFFDMPSVFAVLMGLMFILYVVIKDGILLFNINNSVLLKKRLFSPAVFVVYAIFGLAVYLGALNLIGFDIYHFLSPLWQGVIMLGMACVIIVLDRVASVAFTLSLVTTFMLDSALIDSILCAYLWLFSVVYSLYYAGFSLIKNNKISV